MNKAEILRYLRTKENVKDDMLIKLLDDCIVEVEQTVHPKTIYRIFDCSVFDDRVIISDVTFNSRRLAQCLIGCNKVCVFAATLGTECDRLIRTYTSISIARSAVLQAVLASKIEEVCDALEETLKDNGYKLTKRFSPGYFDLDIATQKDVFDLLDITKRIGITLTDTCQMIPTKSVTAFIGIRKNSEELCKK